MKRTITLCIAIIVTLIMSTAFACATDFPENEPNNLEEQGNIITPAEGDAFSGTLTSDDTDFFYVNMDKGSKIICTVSFSDFSTTGDYEIPYIYCYLGSRGYTFEPDGDEYSEKQTIYLPAGKTSCCIGSSGYNCNYTITFSKVVPHEDFDEPNNCSEEAPFINTNKVYKGLLTFDEDSDVFRVSKAGTYYFAVKDLNIPFESEGEGDEDFVYCHIWTNAGKTSYFSNKKKDAKSILDTGETVAVKGTIKDIYKQCFSVEGYSDSGSGPEGMYQFCLIKEPVKVTGVKAKRISSKKSVISWKKCSGVTGYKVYRAAGKNGTFKKIATTKGASKVSYTDKKISKGKKYYYKVCSYKTILSLQCKGPQSTAAALR